ncbi:protein kinase [Trypanosoma rangeli]|uniref:Protein kinase n=1 Tax=Trypanosoma rangeli TaxID=5698 RepID=A0A422NUX0_TRYRA|nr:protein kinase [Trypanosoma rangeli]RNF09265.1 protein kinase [Trypanosoma rangeli]|eukprot:RNF09265.1 protein kinase [Trypanosoma rangeli]
MNFASDGSLYNMLRRYTKFKVDQAKQYLRDVLKGLAYLHRKVIFHRNIKPQNVLFLETELCKLSDFGTSKRLLKLSNTSQPGGNAPYMDPETARGKAEKASDIWSFGIMMAQILKQWSALAQHGGNGTLGLLLQCRRV